MAMTPRQILSHPVQESFSNLHDVLGTLIGCYFNHIPEFGENIGWSADDGTTRVTIKLHYYRQTDYRRFARVASVWLDDRVVMLIENAGREGDDHHARWLLDLPAYRELVRYLRGLCAVNTEPEPTTYQLDELLPTNLPEIYGDRMPELAKRDDRGDAVEAG